MVFGQIIGGERLAIQIPLKTDFFIDPYWFSKHMLYMAQGQVIKIRMKIY